MNRARLLARAGGSAALALVVAGCAGAQVGRPAPRGAAVTYVRIVDSAMVLDSAGVAYAHPFLGGLNLPRPQLVDIDGDGDLDLFVQERSGELIFFEQVGGPVAPRWEWRTDRFQNVDIGEWFRFVDLDGDGDPDLLAEERFSYIRYYRNEGGPTAPRLVLAADTLRDVSGQPLFSDRQNIPNVADIDCNGRPDLFLGRLVGTVDRYEQDGNDAQGLPRFRLVTERFEGIEIVAQMVGSRHGANTLALADIDGDGDLDLFWGDFFEQGLLLIPNTGSCASPNLRNEPIPFPPGSPILTSGYNAPTFGDLDGDGRLDLVLGVLGGAYTPNTTSVENLYWLAQPAPGEFALRTRQLLTMLDVGSESVPALGDLDGDGDLDLLLGNKIDAADLSTARVYLFENVGNRRSPRWQARGHLPVTGAFHFAPTLGDLDGDGDLDLLTGTWRNAIRFYRNEGTARAPRFILADTALVTITRGSNTTPALGDLDGDGDLDLLIGEASGSLNFYRNVGSRTSPVFELVSDSYLDIDVGRRSAPALVDLDGDGDLDLVIGSETGDLVLYRNEGSRTEPRFVRDEAWRLTGQALATPAFGDLTGNGLPDLFLGSVGGGALLFEARPSERQR